MSIHSPIQFYRLKCQECNSKFTISTAQGCSKCSFLGIQCQHRKLCFKCYKKSLRDNVFFYVVVSLFSITAYGLGGRLL